jgi:hypothetical protein
MMPDLHILMDRMAGQQRDLIERISELENALAAVAALIEERRESGS